MKTKNTIGVMALAAGVMALSAGAGAQEFKGFPDVPKNHWAAQAVNDLARRRILQGYPGEPSGGKLKTKTQTQQAAPAPAKKTVADGASTRQRK